MDYPFLGEYRARCEKVIDGDTVDLYIDQGMHTFRQERFRLLKINAPEMKEGTKELGTAAKEYLTSMIVKEGKWPLRIVTKKDPDNFGRYLAEIFTWVSDSVVTKEVSVCTVMVETGHAIWYTR